MRRLTLASVVAAFAVLLLAGCGGGGDSGTAASTAPATTTNVNVTVNWAVRTRDVDAPASALSAVFTLKLADPGGSDFSFTINRDSAPAAYKKSYSSPRLAKVGTWDLAARFYAQADGQGSVVGKIDAQINLTADGKGIGDFATSGMVASVVVAPGQTIPIGTPVDVLFSAKDFAGADLALTPGSAKFQVVTGSNLLTVNSQGQAVGSAVGTATVNVTVDGKTSPDQLVSVGFQPSVTITPAAATIFANGQQGFDVKVDGVPSQYASAVTWSVQEGDAGGYVSGGSYIAPSTPGTYHVAAASQFDATKRAVATVTVTGPAMPNQPGIYVQDIGRLVHLNDMTGAGWGGSQLGDVNYQFAIGPDGKLYFALGNHVLRVNDLSGSNPVSLGTSGSGPLHFGNATGIAVGPDGKIYVADPANNRLVRVDDMSGANWTELSTNTLNRSAAFRLFVSADNHIYALTSFGTAYRVDDMQGAGLVDIPFGTRAIFVAPDGRIYSVTGNTINRIDDTNGANAVSFSSLSGGGTGQFGNLTSIWVAANGQIYVTDPDNHRIVRMDDMTGKNWTALGTQGVSNNEFQRPAQVIVR